ncbi:GGDEF domain-containing protein [Aliiglaciecola sp. M165]|uniref:GGDEF domain-containing protein n=1 Tax=Aliiglaciecola sp. M165 TaxID=2593649 RepID=UPI0011802250|nr:GGDEF domain-containing protein [Aliiglaciecola sp. M165]TRY33868.1 GGDEF domain-containing protein [Aliiglaciecola sp. M165]
MATNQNRSLEKFYFVRNTKLAVFVHPLLFPILYFSTDETLFDFNVFIQIEIAFLCIGLTRYFCAKKFLDGSSSSAVGMVAIYGFVLAGLLWGTIGVLISEANMHLSFLLFASTSVALAAHGSISFAPIRHGAILNILILMSPILFHVYAQGNFAAVTYIVVISGMAVAFVFISKRNFRGDKRHLLSIEEKTTVDQMTGLLNKTIGVQKAEAYLESGFPPGGIAISILDIDHFKAINDTHGHSVGDKCILEMANLIKINVRSHADLSIRYGGEEFVLVLTSIKRNELKDVLERIRVATERLVVKEGSCEVKFTVSAGAAWTYNDGDSCTFKELFEIADKNLYAVKNEGRNGVLLS